VVDALRESNPTRRPRSGADARDLPPAFRAARGGGLPASLRSGDSDRELEQFLVEAAALRVRVNEEAQEIAGIMDETSVTGEAPVYTRAR